MPEAQSTLQVFHLFEKGLIIEILCENSYGVCIDTVHIITSQTFKRQAIYALSWCDMHNVIIWSSRYHLYSWIYSRN